MNQQLITVIVVVASAVLNFLLTQPPGTFSQNILLVIGALSVGLTALARFLPSPGTPVQVEVKQGSDPVAVTVEPEQQ